MPAVDPTRLNFQITALMESFHSPDVFLTKLRDLFSRYANRTLRRGEMTNMAPLMPMYHLPDPVMRRLKSELSQAISKEPESALELADNLWLDETFEVRLVAVFILGHAAVENPEPLLSRLDDWLSKDLEPAVKEAILQSGTQRLQSEFPGRWETWIESLLAQKDPGGIAVGLTGLRVSLETSLSDKLPAVFRLISPFVQNPQPGIFTEMKRLIKVLAEQSPTETAYFLRQALSLSNSPGTSRLIRQSLPVFPEEVRKELQAALKIQ